MTKSKLIHLLLTVCTCKDYEGKDYIGEVSKDHPILTTSAMPPLCECEQCKTIKESVAQWQAQQCLCEVH